MEKDLGMIFAITGMVILLLSIILSKIIGPHRYGISLMLCVGFVVFPAGLIIAAAEGGAVFDAIVIILSVAIIVFLAVRLR